MKSSAVRVLLIGAAGRMGKTIIKLAKADPAIEVNPLHAKSGNEPAVSGRRVLSKPKIPACLLKSVPARKGVL